MSNSILLVDDCEIVVESVRRQLRQGGFEVDVAFNAREARAAAANRQFAAHIIDLELPDAHGVDLAIWLTAHGHHGVTIFHTGHSLDSPWVERARELGRVVTKGTPRILMQVLRSVVDPESSDPGTESKPRTGPSHRTRPNSTQAPRHASKIPGALTRRFRRSTSAPPR